MGRRCGGPLREGGKALTETGHGPSAPAFRTSPEARPAPRPGCWGAPFPALQVRSVSARKAARDERSPCPGVAGTPRALPLSPARQPASRGAREQSGGAGGPRAPRRRRPGLRTRHTAPAASPAWFRPPAGGRGRPELRSTAELWRGRKGPTWRQGLCPRPRPRRLRQPRGARSSTPTPPNGARA